MNLEMFMLSCNRTYTCTINCVQSSQCRSFDTSINLSFDSLSVPMYVRQSVCLSDSVRHFVFRNHVVQSHRPQPSYIDPPYYTGGIVSPLFSRYIFIFLFSFSLPIPYLSLQGRPHSALQIYYVMYIHCKLI